MYSEPCCVNALPNHSIKAAIGLVNFSELVTLTKHGGRPRVSRLRKVAGQATTLVPTQPVPKLLGLALAISTYPAALKCRRGCFQILSCRIAVASSWKDRFHKPRAGWLVVGIERCSFLRLNTLQRHLALAWRGRMHCQPTETDNSYSY